MNILLTPAFDIAYRDIENFELKKDLLFIWIKGNKKARIFPNGKARYKEVKELKDVHDLHTFLRLNVISGASLAESIGVTPAAINNLFNNNHLSKGLKEKISEKHPGVFSE